MSEEEKKAIEQVNYIIEEVRENTKEETPTYIFDRDIKCLPILLNLIEKQQKEIERLENIKNICPITNTSGIKCELKEINENTDMYYEFHNEVMKLVESEEK